jgi:hypothetical protein
MAKKKDTMAKKKEDGELDAIASEQPVSKPVKKPVEKSQPRNGGKEEADFNKTVSDMKSLLESQPKVRVLVPLEAGETIVKNTDGSKAFPFLPVSINGYRLNVPKGVYVDVPQTVADIISESFNIYEQNSATEMRADRNDDVVSALT